MKRETKKLKTIRKDQKKWDRALKKTIELKAIHREKSEICRLYFSLYEGSKKACGACPLYQNGSCSNDNADNSLITQIITIRKELEQLTEQLCQRLEESIYNPTT